MPAENQNIEHGEVNPFWPLCAGGSNDLSNLWFQPISNSWEGHNYGFHEKDDLETWICTQIRGNPNFDIQDAYNRVITDWVAYYREVNPPHKNFGE